MARKQMPVIEESCCTPPRVPGRTPLADRPLLSFVEAVKVMALFKVMANDTRIRLLFF